MIPCQRERFDIPDHVAYLNCAYTSPLLKTARAAGAAAMGAKANPWTIKPADFFSTMETARSRFAELIGCHSDCVALIPAVSYGISLAEANVSVARGQSIVVLADQFPSNVYAWQRVAVEKDAGIRTVSRPPDGDWTRAVSGAIDENTAVVAVPNCHWTDGSMLDLETIGGQCREAGAALVVDAIQSVGAMPLSIPAVRPDFLVAASHKWLLGAYSFGFCYVSPRWHDGRPLEENWLNRSGSEDFARLVDYRDAYQAGARRFDMGEASSFILSPMAAAGLGQILEWGVDAIAETLRHTTDEIARRSDRLGFTAAPAHLRAPHMIGISMPDGFPADLPSRLASENVFVSVRGESIRISPHLYNSEADIDRLFEVLEKSMK